MTKPFRAFDTKILADTYNVVMQFQKTIDALLVDKDGPTEPSELPDSLVPTDVLYSMVLCYDAMYTMLLKDSLIKNGYPKDNSRTIH